jgi:hypothetical protein
VTASSFVLMVARTVREREGERETEREEPFITLVRPSVRKNWDTLIQTSFLHLTQNRAFKKLCWFMYSSQEGKKRYKCD